MKVGGKSLQKIRSPEETLNPDFLDFFHWISPMPPLILGDRVPKVAEPLPQPSCFAEMLSGTSPQRSIKPLPVLSS